MKTPMHAIWVAFLVAIYFAISNDHIWNEFWGRLFHGGSGAKLSEAPKPVGGTGLTPGDQQVLAMNNLDMSAAQVFKQNTGLAIEPYRKPSEAAWAEAMAKHKQSEDTPDASDAPEKKAEPAPSNNQPLSNNELAARNNAQVNKEPDAGAIDFRQLGPVVGFAGQVADPNNEELAERFALALTKKLPSGFVPFATVDSQGSPVVAVIRATDPFEPVRVVGTSAGSIFSSKGTDEIVEKLRQWNRKYPLHLVEVKGDTVVAVLDKVPDDPASLGQEVKKFAPGDGSANADDFTQDIRDNKRLFLWWD
jgi:hypothetical protein